LIGREHTDVADYGSGSEPFVHFHDLRFAFTKVE
jgi:hypothetical protein